VIELTDAERAQWREATATVVDRFVSEGGETAAKVVEEAQKF